MVSKVLDPLGLFSSDTATIRPPTAEETQLGDFGATVYNGAQRQGLTNLAYQGIRDVAQGRTGQRILDTGRNLTDVNASYAGPAVPGDVVDRALMRARGLSRIARSTADTFDNNLLRERASIVQGGLQRQDVGVQGLAQIAKLTDRKQRGLAAATLQAEGAKQNLLGTALGAGLGALSNRMAMNRDLRASASAGITRNYFGDYATKATGEANAYANKMGYF